MEVNDKPLNSGLLKNGMVGGLIDACNRLRADGVTDIFLQENEAVLRRGARNLINEDARLASTVSCQLLK